MKYLTFVILICLFGSSLNAQNLDVDGTAIVGKLNVKGKAMITRMDKDHTADSVVVKLADGNLGIRHLSTMGDADADPTNEIETWSTLAGIPAAFSDNIDDVGITFETDPQVGVVTSGRWCISDGVKVNCTQLAPDTDPNNEIQNLFSVLTESNNGGSTQIKNIADPTAAQDAATKAYVDNVLLAFGLSIGSAGIQGLLNAGYAPSEIINGGVSKDGLYGKTYQDGLIFYIDDQISMDDPTKRLKDNLSALLTKVVKKQQSEIESLTEKLIRVDELKEENNILRERLNKIETLLNITQRSN